MKYENTWDLESIFVGGTKSPDLQEKLTNIEQTMNTYEANLINWNPTKEINPDELMDLLAENETIVKSLGQARTFVTMTQDANMNDTYANVVMGKIMKLFSELQKLANTFTKKLISISDDAWKNLLKDHRVHNISFRLNEMRDQGKRLLSDAEETLIADLNPDGLAGWSSLYDTIVSIMTIPFTDETGKTTELSVGQAMNRMYADSNRAVRKQLFENWEAAWDKYAPIFTDTLNHLAGYRLTLQKRTDTIII